MSADPQSPPDGAEIFAQATAADLMLLAALHASEPTGPVLAALRELPFQERLGLLLDSAAGTAALASFDAALAALPAEIGDGCVNALAADYAEVYLSHGYRASPMESVWLDEDGLARQAPMFAVRGWYRRHGLEASDWARRSDDHLVLELQFLAHLMRKGALEEAARFMDEHLLRWVPRFAGRLCETGAPAFYAGLAAVTAAYAEALRGHLVELAGLARQALPEKATAVAAMAGRETESAFFPGAGPGW
jgi:TorA maturation chaperone TorD